MTTACHIATYFKLISFDRAAVFQFTVYLNYYMVCKKIIIPPQNYTIITPIFRQNCLCSKDSMPYQIIWSTTHHDQSSEKNDQLHIMTNHSTKYEIYRANRLRGVAFTKSNYMYVQDPSDQRPNTSCIHMM